MTGWRRRAGGSQGAGRRQAAAEPGTGSGSGAVGGGRERGGRTQAEVLRAARGEATTLVKRKPRWDFSIAGLMYVTMTMFMGIAAMNTQANLLFGVFGLMLSVGLVCFVISRLMLVGLSVRRMLPDAAVVGVPVGVSYEFHNGKRFWPSMSVQLSELDGVQGFVQQPHAYLLHAASGTTAAVKAEVVPKRRGVYSLGAYQVSTSFPFGFVKRALTRFEADTLVIFPPLARVDARLLRWLRSSETAGVTVRPQRGGEDEVYGVKEYRSGENPRLIHWKRSARTGQLVAREMTRVSPPRVMVVVDTYRSDDSVQAYALAERTVAVGASLASALLEQGLMVGLAVVDGGDAAAGGAGEGGGVGAGAGGEVLLLPNRGKRHRRDVLSVLARVETTPKVTVRALMSRVVRTARAGTTVVLVTGQELLGAGAAVAAPGALGGGGTTGAVGTGEESNRAKAEDAASVDVVSDAARAEAWTGLAERVGVQQGVVVLNVRSPLVAAWFRFDDAVDFSVTMPAAHTPAAGLPPGVAAGSATGTAGAVSGGADGGSEAGPPHGGMEGARHV